MDEIGQIINIIVLINNGGIRGMKYFLNVENINDVTCIDPPAADTICVPLH